MWIDMRSTGLGNQPVSPSLRNALSFPVPRLPIPRSSEAPRGSAAIVFGGIRVWLREHQMTSLRL